jgi:hypothetical protein
MGSNSSYSAFVHWALSVSLRLGAIEAQWFRLLSELEAETGEIPLLEWSQGVF